ncbi:GNAT family N-acetyltransferase [Nitrosomonas sp.]|uniref:GNAT family N-acetyltransferase n=1 Tax=Nitrosomonas sp. TaxID=42353 RepID=UPI0025CBDE73|nr:GNAT family N-acetyltransferase [Nitrosomonas sp.]MCC6915729.1 GNAT family N-acetyltransferase [Nitrosomonas sp.]
MNAHQPAVLFVSDIPDSHEHAIEENSVNKHYQRPFYQLAQKSLGNQFEHRYLILKTSHGKSYVQLLFLVNQNIFEGLAPVFRQLLTKWAPRRLSEIRMLMVGCPTGEGALAGNGPDGHEISQLLREHLHRIARELKVSLIVFKDFPASYRDILSPLLSASYIRIPSFPACKIDLIYQDFEDYLKQALSRNTRKDLYRKFREADRFGQFSMEVIEDFTPVLDEIYPLYCQVLARSKFKFEILTKDYFAGLGKALGGSGRFFIWRDTSGKIVAFNLCVLEKKVLRDCYIGLDYQIALAAHLYFVSFRDIISWAIRHNLEQYYTSPLNYSSKLHLKMDLAPLDLYIRHVNPAINFLCRYLMPALEPTQYDPLLPKFQNYKDLR